MPLSSFGATAAALPHTRCCDHRRRIEYKCGKKIFGCYRRQSIFGARRMLREFLPLKGTDLGGGENGASSPSCPSTFDCGCCCCCRCQCCSCCVVGIAFTFLQPVPLAVYGDFNSHFQWNSIDFVEFFFWDSFVIIIVCKLKYLE